METIVIRMLSTRYGASTSQKITTAQISIVAPVIILLVVNVVNLADKICIHKNNF